MPTGDAHGTSDERRYRARSDERTYSDQDCVYAITICDRSALKFQGDGIVQPRNVGHDIVQRLGCTENTEVEHGYRIPHPTICIT